MSGIESLAMNGFSVGSGLSTLASVRPRPQLEIFSRAECKTSYTSRACELSSRNKNWQDSDEAANPRWKEAPERMGVQAMGVPRRTLSLRPSDERDVVDRGAAKLCPENVFG